MIRDIRRLVGQHKEAGYVREAIRAAERRGDREKADCARAALKVLREAHRGERIR